MRSPFLIAVATVGVLAAAACHPGTTNSGGQAVKSQPQSSITIGIGSTGNAVATLDPSQSGAQDLVNEGTVMEGLYGYGPDGKLVPKIATRYTSSDDGKVWTFYLRKDAKWSNGKPVTANDFYYSWMRTASPKYPDAAIWASVMSYVRNAYNYKGNAVPASQVGVKVVNPYEIRLTLTASHNILAAMALPGSMPLYGPSVNAHPSDWFMPGNFVSDAPYTVGSFVPNGKISLVRNPKYVGAPGQTNVGNVKTINIMPTPNVPVEDFLSNKLSAAAIASPSDYKYVQAHVNLKSDLHSLPNNQVTYLEWDKSTEASPLDNLQVRQAVAMSLNRQPIVDKVLNGLVGVTSSFGYPGWPTYSLQKPLGYNVSQAKNLLAQAGYPGGKGIPTLYIYTQTQADNPSSIPVAEALQEELKAIGLTTKITPLPTVLYTNTAYNGINPDIHPGYVIGAGTAGSNDVSSLPIQSNQQILFAGAQGPVAYRQHVANYYLPKYDPDDVRQLGNPDDKQAGTTQADWNKLQKVAEADIAYLNAWTKRQPAAYRELLLLPGTATNQQQWDNYATAWKNAKTASAKHAAWVTAWEDFVGDSSGGNGEANIGLNGQVWDDQNMPQDIHDTVMWNSELAWTADEKTADQLAAKLDNYMLDNGYGMPLYYAKTYYLVQPGLTGIEADPWSSNTLYQLQYATWK